MAYGFSDRGDYGADAFPGDLVELLAGSPIVSGSAIGKLQKVSGSITITRVNVIVAQPTAGDLVYEGDLIESGIDGQVAILFVDGTTFLLHASAHMVLDEFIYAAEKVSNSALFRVQKGLFSFLSGKLATVGRLIIDTPVARIQNARPAAGIGSLAFSVFTLGLIHELKAASTDIALVDDGTITCKDLKHGVFEIITKGDHPQRYIVDDPCESIDFQLVGSQIRVSHITNSSTQMAQFHDAFLSTYDTYLRGQQDVFVKKYAEAQPQGTSSVGSSTLFNGLASFAQLDPETISPPLTSNPNTGTSTTTTTVNVPFFDVPTSNVVIWNVDYSGTFQTNPDWNVGKAPGAQDTVEILNPVTVTIDQSEAVGNLMIGTGATLHIVSPGSLTVLGTLTNNGTIEATSGTVTLDPTIINTGTLAANGAELDLVGSTVINAGTVKATGTDGILALQGTTITGGAVVTTNPSDVIETTSGTNSINDASITNVGTLEATAGSTLTIEAGSINNNGELLATADSLLVLEGLTVTNAATVDVDAGSELVLESAAIGGGIVTVDGILASTATSAIIGAVITVATSTGELLAAARSMLTIDAGSINNGGVLLATGDSLLVLEGLTVTNTTTTATVEVDAGSTLDLESATISGGILNVYGLLNSTGASVITDLVLTNTGTIEATGDTLVIDLGMTITNAGTMKADDATLQLDDGVNNSGLLEAVGGGTLALESNVQNNSGGQLIAAASSVIDVQGGGTITNDTATDGIVVDGTLRFEVAKLELLGVGGVQLGGGTITGTGSNILDNDGNTITGYGLIEKLVLQNGEVAGSTIDANISGKTLTLNTGNIISNESGGTLEGTAGGILDIWDALTNAGQLIAAASSVIDVNGGSISNANATDGIEVDGTFKVDAGARGTLELTGSGELRLVNGTITGVAGTEILDNDGNTIAGYGLVEDLTLKNDSFGTIDANVAGKTLTIHTGDTITNAGLMEATATATLDVQDPVSNSGLMEAGGASTLDITGSSISWNGGTPEASSNGILLASTGDTLLVDSSTGTLTLNGSTTNGAAALGAGGQIVATTTGQTLDNVNNDITGDGSIGNANSDLTLKNESFGTIDANVAGKTLTIHTGNTVTNAGLMEATATATLDVQDPVSNSGLFIVTGGSTVDIAGSIFGGNAIIDGGTLSYDGSSNVATNFDGLGTLVLGSNLFTGTVYDFEKGDTIDLAAIPYFTTGASSTQLTYDATHDTLTVSDGSGGPSITIQLAGHYRTSNFRLSQDGAGTEVTLNSGEGPEPPTLSLGGTKAAVNEEGTVVLPSIKVTPVDSDDKLTVTIAGLPSGATITDSADSTVFSGPRFTLTGAEVGSTLTLHDGTNVGNFSLTVTANNTTFDGTGGEVGSSASQTIPVTVNTSAGPAGVAGSPINLALTNPSAAGGGPVAVTISGIPSGWQLNEATNLGNGTWAVQTDDVSALTVMTAAAYAGAVTLGVTETWTNADGSTGTATIADNVEAYAPGTPIFALSGNDTLTGASGNNEFVFAQPIGNDAIYDFNVATDKIDLIGFANVASLRDFQITDDTNGNAVITIGAGETITLHGVNAASLTAADFVFNQTPVAENAGNIVVSDAAVLPLSGMIDNTGTIAINSTGDQTELQIVGDGVTLEGGGKITLSGDAVIVGTGSAAVLSNIDNTISGAGQIGAGDGTLTLVNEMHGTIDANVAGGTLTLETGTVITNDGVLEATNGGTLQIADPVIGSGSALIEGGTIVFGAQSNIHVTFENGAGTPTYGELVLGDAAAFTGQISGFTGTAPNPAHSDTVDLVGFNLASTTFSESSSNGNLVLTATDGSMVATLTFDDFGGALNFTSDTAGTGTLITDPPVTNSSGPSVTIIGPGNDTFVFHSGMGAETIVNFNQRADTIELDHFANIQNVQELASLISTDGHGGAFIQLDHSDSIDIPGVSASYLQAHLQSLVHLH